MLLTRKAISTLVLLLFSILFSDQSRSAPRRYLIIQGDNETKKLYSIGSFVVDYENMHSVVALTIPAGRLLIVIKYSVDSRIIYHAVFPPNASNASRQTHFCKERVPASLLVDEILEAFGRSFRAIVNPPSVITSGYQVNSTNIEALRETFFFDAQWRLRQIDGARLFFRDDLPEQHCSLNYDLCNIGFYFTLEPPVHSPESAYFCLAQPYLAKVLQLAMIALLLPDLINPTPTEFVAFYGPSTTMLEPIEIPRPVGDSPFAPQPDNNETMEEPDPSWVNHDMERNAENWEVPDLAHRLQAIDM